MWRRNRYLYISGLFAAFYKWNDIHFSGAMSDFQFFQISGVFPIFGIFGYEYFDYAGTPGTFVLIIEIGLYKFQAFQVYLCL